MDTDPFIGLEDKHSLPHRKTESFLYVMADLTIACHKDLLTLSPRDLSLLIYLHREADLWRIAEIHSGVSFEMVRTGGIGGKTVKELRELVKSMGISGYSKMTKDELLSIVGEEGEGVAPSQSMEEDAELVAAIKSGKVKEYFKTHPSTPDVLRNALNIAVKEKNFTSRKWLLNNNTPDNFDFLEALRIADSLDEEAGIVAENQRHATGLVKTFLLLSTDNPDVFATIIARRTELGIVDQFLYYHGSRDAKLLQLLADNGVDITKKIKKLGYVIGNAENADVVRVLIEHGMDVNSPQYFGNTPLLHTILNDRPQAAGMVWLLLEAGADPNEPNEYGIRPLHVAVENDRYQIIKLLLEAGADPNLPDNNGNTALKIAARDGDAGMVKLFLDAGADPDAS